IPRPRRQSAPLIPDSRLWPKLGASRERGIWCLEFGVWSFPFPMPRPINIAIIGLGFGAEFIPIYQAHPDARLVAVCQRDPKKLKSIQDAFGIPKGFTDYDELLRDPDIDAIHINTPIPDHAAQSLKALKA